MKKICILITILLFGVWMSGTLPISGPTPVYAQKKDGRKKDPAGPPVVRDKKPDKPKEPPPKRDRKP